ncbi:MAG: hypothetical protein BWY21_01111 [Parcubacteria group bacterium ADurb.Bin216]|nr:MAG: hypothetical protein BWY21_01111 [Parcubacteria group bacterium ADurb.Bin216]
MATPTNLSFPTVAYSSIILNWTPGTGSTNTLIVRKQGSIPTSRTDGTTIYEDNGNAFIDTGLTDNTEYCYALYATDNTEYTEALTGCQTTQAITGLVSHWKFDEGTGTTAYDSAGTNHGTLTNGPTWKTSSDCISGGCLQFDGSNDYIQLSNSFYFSNWSFSLWVKRFSDSGSYERLISHSSNSDYDSFFQIYTDDSVRFGYIDNAGVTRHIYTPDKINLNQWYYLSSTFDGINIRIYINGELKAISNDFSTYNQRNSGYPLTIGRLCAGTCYYGFNGLMDDIKIYNRHLSQEDLIILYEQGMNSYGTTNGKCGLSNDSLFYVIPTENLCSYGTSSVVSGNGPWTWTCSGTSSSVSCSANKIEDGACGASSNIEHISIPSTNLCSAGTASTVIGDGVPYSWTCNGVNGGSNASCEATKTGWVNTGLGFYVMKYEAKIQGNNNGNQTYNSSFVPESRATGTPWINISQAQAITECQSLGTGYHLISSAEWTNLARHIMTVPSNWSEGVVGSGYLSRGYASNTLSGDTFTNSAVASSTGDNYLYNTGADTVGPAGDHKYRRTHILANSQQIWDLGGNLWEWNSDTCQVGSGIGYWKSGVWTTWDDVELQDYEINIAGPSPFYSSDKNTGNYWGCSSNGNPLRKGGDYYHGSNAGIFSIHSMYSSSQGNANTGFRCVK